MFCRRRGNVIMDFTGRRMRTRGMMSTGKESHIASVCKSDSEAA